MPQGAERTVHPRIARTDVHHVVVGEHAAALPGLCRLQHAWALCGPVVPELEAWVDGREERVVREQQQLRD